MQFIACVKKSAGFKNKVSHIKSGFGGLVVSMLASGTRPKPSDFFERKNPQHAFLRKGSKAVCPVSQICGTIKKTLVITWKLDPKAKSVGNFSPEPASLANRGPHVRAAWSASGDDGGN
jgi:hypothetical protein